jgi:hypothetical protein
VLLHHGCIGACFCHTIEVGKNKEATGLKFWIETGVYKKFEVKNLL